MQLTIILSLVKSSNYSLIGKEILFLNFLSRCLYSFDKDIQLLTLEILKSIKGIPDSFSVELLRNSNMEYLTKSEENELT